MAAASGGVERVAAEVEGVRSGSDASRVRRGDETGVLWASRHRVGASRPL